LRHGNDHRLDGEDLRETTGAGMMDCKTALTETGGDVQAAVDWLRKKGLSRPPRRPAASQAEGLIGQMVAPKKGAMVEVNSETDFRRAQRPLPGPGEDDRRRGAQRRQRGHRGDQGRRRPAR
jgi:hypothetical protein